MDNASDVNNIKSKMKCKGESDASESDDELWDSEDDDETIARIQRAHFAETAAMSRRRRPPAKPRPMSQKRKMEAVKSFHDFTKKLKKDTGISIRSLPGSNTFGYNVFPSSEDSLSDSDGLSEEEFEVDPQAVQELNEENESYLDPFTGDIIESKAEVEKLVPPLEEVESVKNISEPPKTLTISDIINEGDLDLSKNVEISEVVQGELCSEKTAEDLLDLKQDENSEDFDITDKLKEMGEINVTQVKNEEAEEETSEENKPDGEDEKKVTNALNMRRNIRDVMDEKQLDASTLAAQRQESERLARVQEQQRIIREVQRQIAINRQNKVHQKTLQLLQGGSSLLKKNSTAQKLGLPNTVLVKLPSGETKKTAVDVAKLSKPGPSLGQVLKPDEKSDKKEVVEIVDSSSGEETSSSSSDSDDCIMLSDSEVPASPEVEEDPGNSGLHVNDSYNIPDEQGRVQINVGHPENEEDIFLAPQIARIIKPHQIGGVRFLFDNIIESVERFSNSTGFGCILAHSMGLGKTLQIVCFTDIFLRHTNSKTVLCIMPINTLQNWVAEFNMWLPIDATISPLSTHGEVRPRTFQIYVLNDSHKTLQMRAKVVKDWATTGGVLMIGYELYRLLSMKKDKKPRKKKKADIKAEEKEREEKLKNEKLDNDDTQGSDSTKLSEGSKLDDLDKPLDDSKDDKKDDINDEEKKLLDEMYEALVKPGPDLVICDEGHRIKNSHSNISYALKQMRTRRRVVLTGYPLQNNLLEYWCMVDFVRPNYLGSKTEFCNMFERPIQNGQCIDSTPQDIRLMRYRAHVLHSLLVGFVQRRSHAVLQSTLPQKAEYVLLVRMTPLQRKLYDRFMNEVVRSTTVPNPLKAFAICCKIWNHPDVLYNFLRKRSEASALIEEDLDLEEIGGVTKAGRVARNKAQPKRAYKTRGAAKKPAATIQPNTSAGASKPTQEISNATKYPNNYPPGYGPPGHQQRPDQSGPYPSQPGYQSQSSYPGYQNPPNQPYNQNYGNNYYQQQQQQPPYGGYPNQYPPNAPEPNQSYNQNYWGNGNYYGNQDYYNNQPYPNNQAPQEYRNNAPPIDYNIPQQQYPQSYPNQGPSDATYQSNAVQPYQQNQEPFVNQQRPPSYPQNPQPYQNHQAYPPPAPYPNNQPRSYPNLPYPNSYGDYNSYNPQYDSRANYNYPNNMDNQGPPQSTSHNQPGPSQPTNNAVPSYPQNDTKENIVDANIMPNNVPTDPYENPAYNYNQSNAYRNPAEPNYMAPYNNFPPHLETKPPLGSGSPLPTWPLSDALKLDVDKIKIEKVEIKTESDTEVKIEDLDTKTIIEDHKNFKKEAIKPNETETKPEPANTDGSNSKKSEDSDSGDEKKKKDNNKGKDSKKVNSKKNSKGKAKTKGRKDRKTSKDGSDSDEHSEKEEKPNREEEMAIAKKAEEDTYDWAADLLKDYIPGIIENSAKMELFFLILNESILLGDRLLLFSQSLFTLNLIEDYLERNYIPGTGSLWERNTNYYRLDGSTHALEREKLINEFNANPHIYLFLVSTRAGSLGINLVGANRVIVFDASWNPCHDTQAVCRVYRYGQRKPCFVYRFVMDWCLEKKIYDRQINKQGMADRVVDECNPDAVLSMKEITNLCFDNDEKENEPKDLTEHKSKYIDVVMQKIIGEHGKLLSKEPFQHESLLVDRKEKKLSSAEKRLAQRGYELEKKAALQPKPTPAYRTVRAADGSIIQRPVASVRPMQHGARWIPADVWRRQGMTAQEMTLPLDVVIPTNSAERTNIVLKAGQRVMVLKSPKGIYMQLESGKIIAIKTSFKGLPQKAAENKAAENIVGKKVSGGRQMPANIPGSLKNNSAITITPKLGVRPNLNRVLNRQAMAGQNKVSRLMPGQSYKPRPIIDPKSLLTMKSRFTPQGRVIRPNLNLTSSVSITKVVKKTNEESNDSNGSKTEASGEDSHVLDSDDDVEAKSEINNKDPNHLGAESEDKAQLPQHNNINNLTEDSKSSNDAKHTNDVENITLTTDETLPSESVFEEKLVREERPTSFPQPERPEKTSKISLLKNYRHQRQTSRPPIESSLSQLERTASVLNTEGMPDFRKNLDDITQSYSPGTDDRTISKSKKKKSPIKADMPSPIENSERPIGSSMSHSVSNLLGNATSPKPPSRVGNDPIAQNATNPIMQSRYRSPPAMSPHHSHLNPLPQSPHLGYPSNSYPGMIPENPVMSKSPLAPALPSLPSGVSLEPVPSGYPASATDNPYRQYPGYGVGYGAYPNPSYYSSYGGGYYPPYPGVPPGYPQPPSSVHPHVSHPPIGAPTPEHYPPNHQW